MVVVCVIHCFLTVSENHDLEQWVGSEELENQAAEAPDVNACIERLVKDQFRCAKRKRCDRLFRWVRGKECWINRLIDAIVVEGELTCTEVAELHAEILVELHMLVE